MNGFTILFKNKIKAQISCKIKTCKVRESPMKRSVSNITADGMYKTMYELETIQEALISLDVASALFVPNSFALFISLNVTIQWHITIRRLKIKNNRNGTVM